MKGRALVVPRSRGELVRRRLREEGLLRPDRTILREGDRLAFPVVEDRLVPEGLGELSERAFETARPAGPSDYRQRLSRTVPDVGRLPRAFDVVGDIVLIRIPPELASHASEVGEALLAFVPGARVVGSDHGVHGAERRRSLERIAGVGDWRTRHRENGVEIEVDLERAYFSPRLAREHSRVAEEVREGERVYDLCCGVGPFALTIARGGHAARITAVDSNPEAVSLLRVAQSRRPFGARITVVEARVEEFVGAAEPVERVVLNLPHEGIKYLPSVARTVAPRGRLHYYEVTARTEFERRGEAVVHALDRPEEWTVKDQHVVHPYSPRSDLVAFVFERSPAEGRDR
ncbi:MAG: methyltransferase domain-containing protein [Thermoplasmata archaeon]